MEDKIKVDELERDELVEEIKWLLDLLSVVMNKYDYDSDFKAITTN